MFEKLFATCQAEHPRFLFRYRDLDASKDFDLSQPGYLASLVRDRVIFVPQVASFNDPWDSCPGFTVSAGHSDPAMALSKFFLHRNSPGDSPWDAPYANELRAEIQQLGLDAVLSRLHSEMMNEMRARCVLCLSARGDVPLQWSYYAGGHTGYALCFDSRVMPFLGALPVQYRSEFPKIVVDRAYEPRHALDRTLLSKAEYWRHELEWRVLATSGGELLERIEPQPRNDVDGIYGRLLRGALNAIVVGTRMTMANRLKVQRIAASADPPIRVIEARQVRERFEIHLPGL